MKNVKELLMKIVFFLAACVSIFSTILICVFIFANGVPAIKEIGVFKFLFGTVWKPSNDIYGIFPMIIGSIGVLCAVFMAKFCPEKLYKIMKPSIGLLAGIPSIVYGFFGLVVVVPIIQDIFGTGGKGVLTASIILGIMILPTIISVSEDAVRSVPESYYEGALALGDTHEQAVFRAMVPAAKSGILAGVILGIGRAIGETMAVIIIAGNQTVIPKSILSGVRTMTSNIVMEMGYATGLHRQALIGTGVVLFVFILIINMLFSVMKKEG